MTSLYQFPTQTFGGDGGDPFDDVKTLDPTKTITGFKRITIRSGSLVDSIQAEYLLSDGTTYTAGKHGGGGGESHTINFENGETLIILEGRSGAKLNQLQVTTRTSTNEIRRYGPYGGGGGSAFLITGIVTGFFGRSGEGVDAIGLYINAPTTQLFGGYGGDPFADPTLILNPSVVGFKSITIRSGDMVHSIQAVYVQANGAIYTADKHGGDGGEPHTINFEDGEKIIAIVGRSGSKVDQLTFLTKTNFEQRKTYGPYGGNGGKEFIVNNDVSGFFGRSGAGLDAIAFYLTVTPQKATA